MRLKVVFPVVFVGIVAVACGGARDSEFFAPASPTESPDSGTAVEPGPREVDASVADRPPAPTGGAKDGSTNDVITTIPVRDATPDVTVVVDAQAPKKIYCGDGPTTGSTLDCMSPDICCSSQVQGRQEYSCSSEQDCRSPSSGTVILCHVPSDCAADLVCCGFLGGNQMNLSWDRVECAKTCTSNGTTEPTRLIMCDPAETRPATCPAAKSFCRKSAQLPGFGYCNTTL